MVPDAGCGLRREKVAARGLEELQHRLVLKRRRVGEVDYHLRAGHGLLEPLAGDGVDAALGRRGDDLVAALAQNGNGLRADQAGAADHHELHGSPPLSMNGDARMRLLGYRGAGPQSAHLSIYSGPRMGCGRSSTDGAPRGVESLRP